MIKFKGEEKIYDEIHKALRQTISTHGVIHLSLCDSATKRILGTIKNHLYSCQLRNVKRVRDSDGEYVEIEKSIGEE